MIKRAFTFALYATIMIQGISYAAAPTRTYNYTAGSTISSSQVNTNEIALYTYLQNGVDTIAINAVSNSNIIAGAGIEYSKLNLAGQITNADISNSAGITYGKMTLTNSITDGDIVSITTAGKINGTSITNISGIPSSAGILSIVNGGTGISSKTAYGVMSSGSTTTDALTVISPSTTAGYVLTSNGDSYAPTFKSNLFIPTYTADASSVIASALSEKTTVEQSFVKLKEITLYGSGTLYFTASLKGETSGTASVFKIYRNGSAVGTEKVVIGITYTEINDTVAGWSNGDLIQVYLRSNEVNLAYIKDFKVYGTQSTINTD